MKIPNLRYCQRCSVTFHAVVNPALNCPKCYHPAALLVPGPMLRFDLEPRPARPWSLHPVATIRDFWMGFYFDAKKRRFYFLPVPCLGVWVQLPPRVPGLIEPRQRETNRILDRLKNPRPIFLSADFAAPLTRRADNLPPRVGCAACDRGDFTIGHADECPVKLAETRREFYRRPATVHKATSTGFSQPLPPYKPDLLDRLAMWLNVRRARRIVGRELRGAYGHGINPHAPADKTPSPPAPVPPKPRQHMHRDRQDRKG